MFFKGSHIKQLQIIYTNLYSPYVEKSINNGFQVLNCEVRLQTMSY